MKFMHIISRVALVTMAISLLAISAVAQEKKITAKDVPAAVISAFKAAYPNATISGYAREKEKGKVFYEIESREGTLHRDILYNSDGTVAEVEESIAATDLPSEVQEAFRKQYPRAVITLAERTTIGDRITYEVTGKVGRKKVSREFDPSGKVLK